MSEEKEFVIPQEEADKLKETANMAGKVILFMILAGVTGLVAFGFYWTQIAQKEFPVTVDIEVEESSERQ